MNLESVYGKEIIKRGEGYLDNVRQCIKIGNCLYADVIGTQEYKTKVNLETLEGECSCPYGSNCKHAVAAYLYHKQGKSDNADTFIEHLQKMDKPELIRMIIDNLPKTPEMAVDFTIKNTTNVSDFTEEFINDFSYNKLRKAEKLVDSFSFNQLARIIDFLSKNEEKNFDKIYEDYGVADEGEVLYDFKDRLIEEMVKKISNESELKKTIKKGWANQEIIYNAEPLSKFKQTIKEHFPKEDYLSFLLKLNKPDLDEIKQYVSKDNKHLLWNLPENNVELAESLGKHLQDNTLLFLTALKKKDCTSLLKYFDSAWKSLKNKYPVDTGEITSILMKNKVKDEKKAKELLKENFFEEYSEAHVRYLAGQISDFELIEKQLPKEFSESKPLLERLIQLDREKAKKVLYKPNALRGQSLEDAAKMAIFVKNCYGKESLIDFLESNRETLITASALKNRLKKEGIFVSAQKGNFVAEMEK